mmetsp:Transcript_105523/g.305199  ORF Transcript_105523/g.305199 Transcript_105523/m.305199 type:complete len:592 (+) Transcript_105523:154-1929(+)
MAMAKDLHCPDFSLEVCQRIFEGINAGSNGQVGLSEFIKAVRKGPARAPLRILITKHRLGCDFGFLIPETYDYTKSTNDNYKTDVAEYIGEFADIRRERDYGYHVHYVKTRQAWQDAAIKSVIGRTIKQAAPWLVYTCGPMGVGKGFALDWMSRQGFFPLERIVHIDPDGFKLMMPEWRGYVARSDDQAGTMCHMESCFMMEVAQEAAMQLRQNIWVDGSLRNADFYASQFENLRKRFPHYKIAIFYIAAPEPTIRERIAKRAEATGRNVPEHLIKASLGAMDRSLNMLTPLCDFVARICNTGRVPVLKAFETISVSGSWQAIADRFASASADPYEFPNALAPFALTELHEAEQEAVVRLKRASLSDDEGEGAGTARAPTSGTSGTASGSRRRRSGVLMNGFVQLTLDRSACVGPLKSVADALPEEIELKCSPPSPVTMSEQERHIVGIDQRAVELVWVYPWTSHAIKSQYLLANGCRREDIDHPIVNLLQRGGFLFTDASGATVQVNAVHNQNGVTGYLQFGRRKDWPEGVPVPSHRFEPTARRFREIAAQFAWFAPGEVCGGANIGGEHGAFAFELEGPPGLVLFPVIA